MPRFITIEILPHTTDAEAQELADEINRTFQPHHDAVVTADAPLAAPDLTPASLELFKALAEDSPNWSGSPLVSADPATKGNLTHLKKLGLIETFVDEGCSFVVFTDEGIAFGVTLGYEARNLTFGLGS